MAHQPGVAERVWRERLIRFRASELTVQVFCEREGVSVSSFYAWKRRLGIGKPRARSGQSAQGRSETEPLFVPVSVQPLASEVRIELPGGAVVHVPLEAHERVLACLVEAAARPREEGSAC